MLSDLRFASKSWGSTPSEQGRNLRCDDVVPDADLTLDRAIDIAASPSVVFRWLCQLRVAPYSYDLLDNFGRQSPRELTAGLDNLDRGQRFMTMFRLVDFVHGHSLTLRSRNLLFGTVAVTYTVRPAAPETSRLHVRVKWTTPRIPVIGAAYRALAPTGDLVMMRKQLITLKALAERP